MRREREIASRQKSGEGQWHRKRTAEDVWTSDDKEKEAQPIASESNEEIRKCKQTGALYERTKSSVIRRREGGKHARWERGRLD
jgi:hypothetical protein